MTLNRMGKTPRPRKRGFGDRRTWITGTVAAGLVATSGAVASATLMAQSDAEAAGDQDCLTLDQKTMKAIFEAWMEQGGAFRADSRHSDANAADADAEGTEGKKSKKRTTSRSTSGAAGSGTAGSGTAGSGNLQPRSFRMGWTPASVPLSELSIGACDNPGEVPVPDPTTAPTDIPIDQPTEQPPADQPTEPTVAPTTPAPTTPPAPTVTSTAS